MVRFHLHIVLYFAKRTPHALHAEVLRYCSREESTIVVVEWRTNGGI